MRASTSRYQQTQDESNSSSNSLEQFTTTLSTFVHEEKQRPPTPMPKLKYPPRRLFKRTDDKNSKTKKCSSCVFFLLFECSKVCESLEAFDFSEFPSRREFSNFRVFQSV